MATPWYETFFTPMAVDFWSAAVSPEVTQAEVEFIARRLGTSPPARLLDLPCGTGRHADALAGRGYDVTGIDLSRVALARAAGAARLFRGDMRTPPPGGPYDGAICFGNSFGYLSHAETFAFARNVFGAVRPGARWVIDTGLVAEALLPHLVPERSLEAGGVTYSVRNRLDPQAGRLLQECCLTRGGEREETQISYGVYTVAELCRLLESQGWRVLETLGALDGHRFSPGDRRLLLVAERP